MDYDLLIIAAGNGTRMGNISIPKALININGTPNLENTLNKINGIFRRIYVVSNKKNVDKFDLFVGNYIGCNPKYNSEIRVIAIDSGKGDGHAVMEAIKEIKNLKEELTEKFFILWGDAYISNNYIFEECISFDKLYDIKPMLVPVVKEDNPYVTFLTDNDMNCISVDFSKRGEKHLSGFHDQCIFLCCKTCLENSLDVLNAAYYKNGRYITDSGEMTFLYIIHYFYNIGFPARAIVTDYPQLSYNTQEEIKIIEEIINEK
jgi:NDP-sugar pyrophosphorylase family protein